MSADRSRADLRPEDERKPADADQCADGDSRPEGLTEQNCPEDDREDRCRRVGNGDQPARHMAGGGIGQAVADREGEHALCRHAEQVLAR